MFKEYLQIIKLLLTPKEVHSCVMDIELEALYAKGLTTIFVDVDNTIMAVSQRSLSLEYQNWVAKAQSIGFNIFILSNNSSFRRINVVAKQTEMTGLYFVMKPFAFGLRDLAGQHGIDLTKSIVLGDQVLTDVLLGNWVRAYSILVDPMDKKLSFLKTLQRELKLFLLKKIVKLSES